MVRFIATVRPGVAVSSAQTTVANVQGVVDARGSRSTSAVIISADEGTREDIAALPEVDRVFDDIQAIPQVATREQTEEFLQRVRELRGEANVPALMETEPASDDEDILPDGGEVTVADPSPAAEPQGEVTSLSAGVDFLGVPAVHSEGTRGDSAIAVVVDTGICDSQIEASRQMDGADVAEGDDPWNTSVGDHGSMSGGIMAGGPATTGIETGVLPEADVFPIKTTLAASEIIQAQDIIIELADDHPDRPIVVNNSWAFTQCSGVCDHPVTDAIDNTASRSGIVQVFAAGNQAETCGQSCDGSDVGISGPNSLDSVITVGATGRNGVPSEIQSYSSRGASATSCGSRKPDVVAPVFGVVPWGCGQRDLGNGPGTSAAAPEVAGLVGLFLDRKGRSSAEGAATAIRRSATGSEWGGCFGNGNAQATVVEQDVSQVPAQLRESFPVAAAGIGAGLAGAALRSKRN